MMRSYIKLRHFGVLPFLMLLAPRDGLSQRVRQPIPIVSFALRGGTAQGPSTATGSVALIAGGLIIAAILPDALGDRLPYADCAPCDSSNVWSFDRIAIGDYNASIGYLSWVTLIGSMGGSIAMLSSAYTGSGEAEQQAWTTMAYTVLAAGALTGWTKVLFARPRPILYTDQAGLYASRDNGRSFPSGHTSLAFAFAVAAAKLSANRGVERNTEVGLLISAAAATGVLRVLAHRHFPTDVTGGAVLGTLVGIVVPNLAK
jgi:membrane-associated phospholipid phosphatase